LTPRIARPREFAIVIAQGIRHERVLVKTAFGKGAHAIDLHAVAWLFRHVPRS